MEENVSGCFFPNTVYKPSYSRFCPKFRCHGNGGWSCQVKSSQVTFNKKAMVELVWHHSIARPRKLPVIRTDYWDISCTSSVIVDFVPNFVAMATGFGRGRTCVASFNSLTPKTPCYTQRSPGYLLYTVFRKKHPLTFSFISPWIICWFKQKLQWIYPGIDRFWQCKN